MINKVNILIILLSALIFSFAPVLYSQSKQDEDKAKKIEHQADRLFIRQDFGKAMEKYNSVFELVPDINGQVTNYLHLKIANLYILLLDYPSAINHFEVVIDANKEYVSFNDLYNYTDALKNTGQNEKALQICRQYAGIEEYENNQQFTNIFRSLSSDSWKTSGKKTYEIDTLGLNTVYPEYSVAQFKNYKFYTFGHSNFHDPRKIFYPRTKFHFLESDNENNSTKAAPGKKVPFIPVDLQTGAVTFSDDNSKMIITEILYNEKDRIYFTPKGLHFYTTSLKYSDYDEKRNGWTELKPVFADIDSTSYAYPFLFNDNQSLLFSSDKKNGYGGFDIYLSHWNDSLEIWESPVNVGMEINTPGNEIAPAVFEDRIYFASNGHIGYGGYDIYSIQWDGKNIIPGTLEHYEYPINTEFNDFFISPVNEKYGYLVSDRYNSGKDDIYKYIVSIQPPVEESEPIQLEEPVVEPEIRMPETACTVYFAFDKHNLDETALQTLNKLITELNWNNIQYLEIVGYADPIGNSQYNIKLSERRARSVADYLDRKNVSVSRDVDYVGSVELSDEELKKQEEELINVLGADYNILPANRKKILLNRKARRVDIKIIYR